MHHLNIIQEELELQLASDLELWWEWSFLDFGNFGIPPSDPPCRRNAMRPTNTANLNYTETLCACVCVCVCVCVCFFSLSIYQVIFCPVLSKISGYCSRLTSNNLLKGNFPFQRSEGGSYLPQKFPPGNHSLCWLTSVEKSNRQN